MNKCFDSLHLCDLLVTISSLFFVPVSFSQLTWQITHGRCAVRCCAGIWTSRLSTGTKCSSACRRSREISQEASLKMPHSWSCTSCPVIRIRTCEVSTCELESWEQSSPFAQYSISRAVCLTPTGKLQWGFDRSLCSREVQLRQQGKCPWSV